VGGSGWRIFDTSSLGDSVIVGLERVAEERHHLHHETHVEERILSREFHEREIVAIATYRGLLGEVADCLAQGTYGSTVEVRALRDGVVVRLVRRRLGEDTVEAEITGERQFAADAIAESAAYAEELRDQADRENQVFWQELHDAEVRAESARAGARERAREAADTAAILRREGRDRPA
jgi:hypothetical protein